MSEKPLSRTVAESQAERSEIIFPNDVNPVGNLFGGRLMQFIDLVGAVASVRHSGAVTVTASMDHLDFVSPVKVGELVILKASVNRAFKTSMEVGVKAMVEDVLGGGGMRHVASAYLTYVAIDRQGQKLEVPCVVPETEHQKRRFEDAAARRAMRSGETLRKKELRQAFGPVWNL
jgi:acyl-CoA hydrolase